MVVQKREEEEKQEETIKLVSAINRNTQALLVNTQALNRYTNEIRRQERRYRVS